MLRQGARKSVFLSRSGTKKIAAKQLVTDLQDNGARVDVMVGDVSVFADVEAVVSQISGPIGGVYRQPWAWTLVDPFIRPLLYLTD